MSRVEMDLLQFQEAYFERIWGGDKLRRELGKRVPADKVIGEAWLVSDHASHESVVTDGPLQGETLRTLMIRDAGAVLGSRAKPTRFGRFPLLLKILDTSQVLSVQVHPDDEAAIRLGEADAGKTEMWHVLDADPGSELMCGLSSNVDRDEFAAAVRDGSVERLLARFPAPAGTSVFIPAGLLHSVGAGILLAEIQQNSDLTYRVYDWCRVDASGKPRELHIGKALQVTHFGLSCGAPGRSLRYNQGGADCDVLAACRFFAAERLTGAGPYTRALSGETFHLLLAIAGAVTVEGGRSVYRLRPGEAVLVPGCLKAYRVEGEGVWLDYYVPDLARDIVAPLRAAGYAPAAIARLGGAPETSDLTPF